MFGKNKTNEWGRSAKPFRRASKMKDAMRKAKDNKALANARREARKAQRASDLESANPIKRRLAQHREKVAKKHEVRMRKLETDAKLNELSPELAIKRDEAKNTIDVERARARSKAASSAALATGMATLGRGLSDENNQDDAASRRQELEIMRTIFNSGSDGEQVNEENGLSRGVE